MSGPSEVRSNGTERVSTEPTLGPHLPEMFLRSKATSKSTKAYFCILMDWSWWPCIAIITSASSSTNILIFLGSTALCRKIQSNIVPGVANKMWSVTFWPGDTEREKYPNIRKKIMWSLFASAICSEILTKSSKLNRPFPNYLWPLFQSESWCSSFHMKISFHLHVNEN